MIILQWVVWAIASLIFVFFLWGIRKDAKNGKPIHIAILIQTIFLLLAVGSFVFLPWSKFQLLWIIPTCFILGWIVGFIFIPVPIIGNALRIIFLFCGKVLLVGTKGELGGFPLEISNIRATARKERHKMHTIENFEIAIKKQEDILFGIHLFNEGVKHLYVTNPNFKTIYGEDALDIADFHYKNIMERGKKKISAAKELLEKVKNQAEDVTVLRKFEFPPIHGPGLDEMTQRATLLVKAYERLFPERPRNIPLSEEENKKLMEEVVKNFGGESV